MDAAPAWSPDGSSSRFCTARRQARRASFRRTGGRRGASPDGFYGAGAYGAPPSWSPDGTRIAYTVTTRMEPYKLGPAEYTDVFVVDAEGLLERRLTAATG